MYRIGEMSKRHRLSRSALLYYDAIGLLSPFRRTEAGYRLYSEADDARLANICAFKQAGVSLDEIRQLLDRQETGYGSILIERFQRIGEEIQTLKKQQATIAGMLKDSAMLKHSALIDRNTWNSLMHSTGLTGGAAREWHAAFERVSPKEHSIFLDMLGFTSAEINQIREWSRDGAPAG